MNKEEFLLKVICCPLNKHCRVLCQKNSTFFKTSVCLIRLAKHFLRSLFVRKNTLLAIEKCQEIKLKGKKSEFKSERIMGFKNYVPINYNKMIFQQTIN